MYKYLFLLSHIVNLSDIFTKVPKGDKANTSSHSVVTVRKAKRDTDRTSESECESGMENRRRTRIPGHHNSTRRMTTKEPKSRRSDTCVSILMWFSCQVKYSESLLLY